MIDDARKLVWLMRNAIISNGPAIVNNKMLLEEIDEALMVALRAAQAEGAVMAPVEPTETMLSQGSVIRLEQEHYWAQLHMRNPLRLPDEEGRP